MGGKWMLDGVYQKNPSPATWVRSSMLACGHSPTSSAAGLSREERCPPQPMATCPCWNLAVCAKAGTGRVGGLTSGGNEVFWSQCWEGTAGGVGGTRMSLFTFPTAINCLCIPA